MKNWQCLTTSEVSGTEIIERAIAHGAKNDKEYKGRAENAYYAVIDGVIMYSANPFPNVEVFSVAEVRERFPLEGKKEPADLEPGTIEWLKFARDKGATHYSTIGGNNYLGTTIDGIPMVISIGSQDSWRNVAEDNEGFFDSTMKPIDFSPLNAKPDVRREDARQEPDWTTSPEGANLFWTNPQTSRPWFKIENGILFNFDNPSKCWIDVEDIKRHLDPNSFIERPTINHQLTVPVVKESLTTEKVVCSKTEPTTWNGQGLPPVGTVCTIRLAFNIISNATITYMGDSVYCYRDNKNGMEYTGYLGDSAFAQIKTDRDHWIDAVNKALAKESCLVSDSILSVIYDAGLAKLPEQPQ